MEYDDAALLGLSLLGVCHGCTNNVVVGHVLSQLGADQTCRELVWHQLV